jgi:hypothetical protein
MKRGIEVLSLLLILVVGFVSADSCSLNVSMINQDPYPAIPGESVKVVFQINGVSNPLCGNVEFEVKENFPFTIDPESTNPLVISSGTYTKKYSSFYLAPYKIRIDEDAMKGDTPIEVLYSSSTSTAKKVSEFNIYIEDTKADFEVYVKDYNANTRALTLEILNIEDVDVEALTIEIPKQENIEVKGANRVVVGNLDSNEYTTADFEAIMKNGEIELTIYYTDSVNVRRQLNKTITFDSSYFTDLARDQSSQPIWLYIIILAAVGWFAWRKYKKHKLKKKMQHDGHLHLNVKK